MEKAYLEIGTSVKVSVGNKGGDYTYEGFQMIGGKTFLLLRKRTVTTMVNADHVTELTVR